MPDARIRRAAAADLPVLTQLWQTAFGDPPELIGAFYHRFPPQAAAWVVEMNGTVVTDRNNISCLAFQLCHS